MAMRRGTKIVIWLLAVPAVLVVGFIVFAVWFNVATKQYYYAAFGSDQYNLSVRSWDTAGVRYSLIEINDHDDDSYMLLEAGELDHALKLFQTARARQSANWEN